MIEESFTWQIIKCALKAPSGHNTQPWKFKIDENSISILPDFTRALSVVDNDNHSLYISLGCALENMLIAASHYNYGTKVEMINNGNNVIIRINLNENAKVTKTDLFDLIGKRQVTRNEYSIRKVPKEDLDELFENISNEWVKVKLFQSETEIEHLSHYIIEGVNLQFNNKSYLNELIDWIRFSEKEAMQKGDGLWTASMGFPDLGRFAGSLLMKNFITAKSETKRWEKLIHNSAGFALFMVEKNDTEHWIKLGQAFQRFGLKSTRMNLRHSHANMPCEESFVREKLVHEYQLNNLVPLLLIRFGYSTHLPYSYRRDINDVIIKE
ncbi:MAG: hypothetical protein Q8880_03130 [Bacteroidota bacterium]|nr:hypothetical protein [Bacteroidota bacterium]